MFTVESESAILGPVEADFTVVATTMADVSSDASSSVAQKLATAFGDRPRAES